MKFVIEADDKEKLLCALNNSIVALTDIAAAFYTGCEVPSKWFKWMNKYNRSYEDCYSVLKERLELLRNIYKQIEGESDV